MFFFNHDNRLSMASLGFRVTRDQVLQSNMANSQTPGFRAIGYDFEEQLQAMMQSSNPLPLATHHPNHHKHEFVSQNGEVLPDVYVKPQESVGQDGNTVDLDREMAEMAQNQIIFRSVAEGLSRKIGLLKYAIDGR